MYWFGARSLGHVAEKELKAWDADAFEASLAEVKRGRDKLELALEEARAHENGGGAVSVDVGSTPEAVVETAAKEGSEAETPVPAPAAKKKRGGGGRKKVIEEEEDTVEMSDVEIEFRALVTELMAAGVEPSDMMDDPRWEDISERAMATGFETWPVFLQLTAMQ